MKSMGSMLLRFKDSSTTTFTLFGPWGRNKVGDRYMIADFDGIKRLLKNAIINANRYLN